MGVALRDDPKNGCEEDYSLGGSGQLNDPCHITSFFMSAIAGFQCQAIQNRSK